MFCRSHGHLGLDQALTLFRSAALLELGLDATDGTGATLAWPLVRSAAALLTEVADGEDPGPSHPGDLGQPEIRSLTDPLPVPEVVEELEAVEPANPADAIFGKALY
jgi:nicotinate-nucleotide--dimethylbenzimidazole phosphoribosyltransferase